MRETVGQKVDRILERSVLEMMQSIKKFPQPNYVSLKVSEEAGELIQAAVHYAEGRETWETVENEAVQMIAMGLRLIVEGDQINGIIPPPAKPKTKGQNDE